MIYQISEDNKTITITIETVDDYGEYTLIDYTDKQNLYSTTYSSIGEYTINAEDVGISSFSGIFELTKGEQVFNIYGIQIYKNCLLEKILKSSLDECGNYKEPECCNCSEESIVTFSSVLKGLEIAIGFDEKSLAQEIMDYIIEFYDCRSNCGC